MKNFLKTGLALAAAIFLLGIASCKVGVENETPENKNEPPKNTTVNVTGISLSESEYTLEISESFTLKATVLPENATNKNVKWSSTDEKIAAVDDGVVTGISEGVALIVATTEDGNKIATCTVKVLNLSVAENFYTVKYFYENIDDDDYTENESERKSQIVGTVGETTAETANDVLGFEAPEIEQVTIAKDSENIVVIKYARKRITLIFDLDGGVTATALGEGNTLTGKYGASLVIENPTKTGYAFTGWKTGETEVNLPKTFPAKTESYKAMWIPGTGISYTVRHLLETVTGTAYEEDTEALEQKVGTTGSLTSAIAKSYTGFTAQNFEQKTIAADGSTVVEIKYNRNTITLTFDLDGGATATTLGTGNTLTGKYSASLEIKNPTKTGYIFAGWKKGETAATLPKRFPETNQTYTASWIPCTDTIYTVNHLLENISDDDYTLISSEKKYGTTGAKTEAAAKEYQGFTSQTVTQKVIEADGSAVVEIKYNRNTITLTFDLDGGATTTTLENDSTLSGKYEAPFSIAEPTRKNYIFSGWSPDLPEKIPLTDTTYKAIWSKNFNVSVTISQSDISEIEMTKDEAAGTVTLTAPSGYTSYAWRVDGTLQSSASAKNTLTLNVSELDAGLHQVFVMIDNMYSSTIIVAIEK